MKQVWITDDDGFLIDTRLWNGKECYNGDGWNALSLNEKVVELPSPSAKKVKWDGSRWNVIEPEPAETSPPVPSLEERIADMIPARILAERIEEQKQEALNILGL